MKNSKRSMSIFGEVVVDREDIVASEVKKIQEMGYTVVDKRGKNHGTRLWFILRKNNKLSIALLALFQGADEGWLAKWFHEDSCLPRLNCPVSILRKVSQKAQTTRAQKWRKLAAAHMESFLKLTKMAKELKKSNPKKSIRELRQELRFPAPGPSFFKNKFFLN